MLIEHRTGTCQQCGKQTIGRCKYRAPKFCSRSCQDAYHRKRGSFDDMIAAQRDRVAFACPVCGRRVERKRGNYLKTKTHCCSRSCSAKLRTGKRNPNYRHGKVIRATKTCQQCGVMFEGLSKHKFCSLKCAFHSFRKAKWVNLTCTKCGRHYEARRANRIYRRHFYCPECYEAWKANMPGRDPDHCHEVWAIAVKKRDNFTCQLCGYHSQEGFNLHAHHIVPFKDDKRLATRLSNGITLCVTCHQLETIANRLA